MAKIIDGYLQNPEGNVYRPHSNAKTTDFESDKTTVTNAQDALNELYEKVIETGENATSYIDEKITEIINGAPTTLDTLKEVADAFAENDEVIAALDAAIGTKADAEEFEAHASDEDIHITPTERENWNNANDKKHTHANKGILDKITASYTTEEQEKLSGIEEGAEAFAKSVTGEDPTITDSADAPLMYLMNSGYTEQTTLTGKNLCDLSTVTDGYMIAWGTGIAYASSDYFITEYIEVEADTIYTIQGFTTGGGKWYYDENKTPIKGFSGTTFTTPSDCKYIRLTGLISDKGIQQVELGDTSTDYEPYCGGIVSPNPYYPQDIVGLGNSGSIELKTCGKNLLDGSISSQNRFVCECKAGNTYTFSANVLENTSSDTRVFMRVTDTYIGKSVTNKELSDVITQYICDNYGATSSKFTLQIKADADGYLYVSAGADTGFNYLENLQVELGDTATDYEPYTETTASIPLDAPLYEGDYIECNADGSGKLVRNSMRFVFSEEYFSTSAIVVNGHSALLIGGFGNNNYHPTKWIMDRAVRVYTTAGNTNVSDGMFYINPANIVVVGTSDDTVETLLEKYAGCVLVMTGFSTPVDEIDLTAEQVEQFLNLRTFDKITNINADGIITVRYCVNNNSGKTAGMLQDQINEIKYNYTVTSNADFDFGSIDE